MSNRTWVRVHGFPRIYYAILKELGSHGATIPTTWLQEPDMTGGRTWCEIEIGINRDGHVRRIIGQANVSRGGKPRTTDAVMCFPERSKLSSNLLGYKMGGIQFGTRTRPVITLLCPVPSTKKVLN